jgi:hypothetical protein
MSCPGDSTCRPGDTCFFGHSALAGESHTAILQALNRWMAWGGERVWYGTENFDGTGADWDRVPVIYAQTHPDPRLLEDDLDAALAAVRTAEGEPGRICGSLSGSRVEATGQPRLESRISFTDPEVDAAYQRGELSLSTAFWSSSRAGAITGRVRPNHLLVFKAGQPAEEGGGGVWPRDPGAMFLNSQSGDGMPNDKIDENAGRAISAASAGKLRQALDLLKEFFAGMTGEGSGEGGEAARRPAAQAQAHTEAQAGESEETDNMADNEGAIAALRAENEALRAEIAAAKQANEAATAALNAVEQERRDQAWASTRDEHVPQGWLAREGAEAELRTEFEQEPIAFMNRILAHRRAGETPEEGSTAHLNAGSEQAEINAAMARAGGRSIPGRLH